MTGTRHSDEGAARQRDSHCLALTAVDPVVAKPAPDHALRGNSSAAIWACAVAKHERRDDEVALRNASHFRTNPFHHADEFVADRAEVMGRLAAVVPKVRTAHT